MNTAHRSLVVTFCLILISWTMAWAINPPVSGGLWLKGDLHSHSNQSDGINSVADHMTKAQLLGFDYYVITDHDNSPLTMGYPAQWYNQGYRSSSMVLLYGMEWTTGN